MWALARRLRPEAVGHFEVLADPLEVGAEEVEAELTIHYREDVDARIEVGLVRRALRPSRPHPRRGRRARRRAADRRGGRLRELAAGIEDRGATDGPLPDPADAPYSHEGECLSLHGECRPASPTAWPRRAPATIRSGCCCAVAVAKGGAAAPCAIPPGSCDWSGRRYAGRHRSGACDARPRDGGRDRDVTQLPRAQGTEYEATPISISARPAEQTGLGRDGHPFAIEVPDDAPPTLEARHGALWWTVDAEGRRARGLCRPQQEGGDSVRRAYRPRISRRRRSRSWSASTALSGASSLRSAAPSRRLARRRTSTPSVPVIASAWWPAGPRGCDCARRAACARARPSARPSSFGPRPASPPGPAATSRLSIGGR